MTNVLMGKMRFFWIAIALAGCDSQFDQNSASAKERATHNQASSTVAPSANPASFSSAESAAAAAQAPPAAPEPPVQVFTAQSTQADAAQPASLSGARADQIARIFRNIILASQSRHWEDIRAAFPGSDWAPRKTHAPAPDGSTIYQGGAIKLGGAVYDIHLNGARVINNVSLSSPADDMIEWDGIVRALRTLGLRAENIGCHSPTGFGFVRLTNSVRSVILLKAVNYGSRVPSTDEYSFNLNEPFDGRTEAEIIRDRTLCD